MKFRNATRPAYLAVALLFGTGAEGGEAVQISCRVDGQHASMPADFEQRFCASLTTALTAQLKVTFVERDADGWKSDGPAVVVRLRLRTPHLAEVTIESGGAKASRFLSERSSTATLSSMDSPITSVSSTALVRGIGLQLGLID